jgi:hypothetical protein
MIRLPVISCAPYGRRLKHDEEETQRAGHFPQSYDWVPECGGILDQYGAVIDG